MHGVVLSLFWPVIQLSVNGTGCCAGGRRMQPHSLFITYSILRSAVVEYSGSICRKYRSALLVWFLHVGTLPLGWEWFTPGEPVWNYWLFHRIARFVFLFA